MITAITYNELGLPVFSEIGKFTDSCFFSMMGLWSLCFAIVAIALAVGISFVIDYRYKWFENLANKYLSYAFVVVWLFGFVVYDMGMYTGEPWSLLGNVPMAILHAFEMFIINSDVSAIHEPFHNNGWFMFGFSLAHFLAAFVSLVFVLKHFGFSIIAAFKRWLAVSSKDNTYIFWGMNNATYYLAKDINKKFAGRNDFRIVVVRTNNDIEGTVAKNGMERLFNFLSLNNKDLDRLKELDCFSMSTYSNLATVDSKSGDGVIPSDILHDRLRLTSLCRIIKNKTKSTLHIFFLSDNEEDNILAVANLRNDMTIRSFTEKGKVKLYCHARYNSIHRVIEDELTNERIEVKVIDSSHISVEQLKAQPILHPVNYVKVEKDATVSTPFDSLVIGLGEVGLDSVRFLYEFGAFVKYKSWEGFVERSDFHCYAVDQNMDRLVGIFTASVPSIDISIDEKKYEVPNMLNLYSMDCRSKEFYDRLKCWIKTLNYIVIATGDDEINISLAVRIFRLAIQLREENGEFERLRILVRVQHDENRHIQNIAYHYNRIWAANAASRDLHHMHQNEILANQMIETPITLFGSAEQVYTYDNVVTESLKEDAKIFKRKYDLSINELKRISGEEGDDIVNWDDEQNLMMQLAGDYKGYAPTYSAIMKLRRTQSQNIANSLHKETKVLLAKKALGEMDYNNIALHGLVRKEGSKSYSWLDHSMLPIDKYQKVLDTLAQTEHLRWNASHEILGYRNKEDEKYKDEAKLYHGCLKDWKDLTEVTQSYDYNIVDVSLNLIDVDNCEL